MPISRRLSLRLLTTNDWHDVQSLWIDDEGLVIRSRDGEDGFARLLERNPLLNYGAYSGAELIGVVLAGYDGYRGCLYHLSVVSAWRRTGVGSALIRKALEALRADGAWRIHVLVKPENAAGVSFWQKTGFWLRRDVALMTLEIT